MSDTTLQNPPPGPLLEYKERANRRRDLLAALALFVAVVVLYSRTATFGFVDFDDNQYVFENPIVRGGLSWDAIAWAFTTGYAGNWHPFTWISHLLDVTLFGVTPGAFHAVNFVLHAINAVLLFALLRLSTGAYWRSIFVAALFALHPLRVESVAWIAERKDVLSTLFWLLTMLAYVRYVRSSSLRWYGAMLGAFALGLMSKGMLVTLPFVLVLLDFWPLRRAWRRRLLLEKLPLLAIALSVAFVTYRVQSAGGAVTAINVLSPSQRVFNALASYLDYVRLSFVPIDIAVFYPNPYFIGGSGISALKLSLAAAMLLGITIFATWQWRRLPYLLVGWLWFLGALVPVIGLVQIGSQARADRYTYVPSIGLTIAVVWLLARWRHTYVLGIAAILTFGGLSFHQIGFWRDSQALMQRAADVVPNNALAHTNLGTMADAQGDLVTAEREYRLAERIASADPVAAANLGAFLVNTNRAAEGLPYLQRALVNDPTFAPACLALGDYYAEVNKLPRAREYYERGLTLAPNHKQGLHHYALFLAMHNDFVSAATYWQRALAVDPDYVPALDGYSRLLILTGEKARGEAMMKRLAQVRARRGNSQSK